MSATTPNTTDNVIVIADQILTLGATKRGTLDLRANIGAFLSLAIGRTNTTALGSAVDVQVRPLIGNADALHPNAPESRQSSTAAGVRTTLNGGNTAIGSVDFTLTATTSFASDDKACFWGTATAPDTLANGSTAIGMEFVRVSKIASPTLTSDSPSLVTRTAAEYVTNKADVFPRIWLPGGCLYEVIFDYGKAATGDRIGIRARAQKINNYTTA